MSRPLKNICAVVLAAGKGTRMNLKDKNKAACEIGGIPMISRTIANLRQAQIDNIVVVVGYAKGSILPLLDDKIKTAYQRRRLGTGHAVKTALKEVSGDTEAVLVLNSDDSFMLTPKVLQKIFNLYREKAPALCFLTTEVDNPTGLGRIVRDRQNKVTGIVEEKSADDRQKKIREINPACYLFQLKFLKKFLPKIRKNPGKGEYYLTDLIGLAVENNEPLETFKDNNLKWRGVNTVDELKEAEKILTLAGNGDGA